MTPAETPTFSYEYLQSQFISGQGDLYKFSTDYNIMSMHRPCMFSNADLLGPALQKPENARLAVRFYCMKLGVSEDSREYNGAVASLVHEIVTHVQGRDNADEFVNNLRAEVNLLLQHGRNKHREQECHYAIQALAPHIRNN